MGRNDQFRPNNDLRDFVSSPSIYALAIRRFVTEL